MYVKGLIGVIVPAITATGPIAARPVPLLIGAYTGGTSKGIALYRFDDHTGRISAARVQVMPAENPSWLVLSDDHRTLCAVNENGEGLCDPVGRVSAWQEIGGQGRNLGTSNRGTANRGAVYLLIASDGWMYKTLPAVK
jgi:6-phosphogluconolactonase